MIVDIAGMEAAVEAVNEAEAAFHATSNSDTAKQRAHAHVDMDYAIAVYNDTHSDQWSFTPLREHEWEPMSYKLTEAKK